MRGGLLNGTRGAAYGRVRPGLTGEQTPTHVRRAAALPVLRVLLWNNKFMLVLRLRITAEIVAGWRTAVKQRWTGGKLISPHCSLQLRPCIALDYSVDLTNRAH